MTRLVKALIQSIPDPIKLQVTASDKDAAKKQIDDAAKQYHDKVKEMGNTDSSDQDEIEGDLEAAVENAKAAIDKAKSKTELDAAVSDGLDKINNLPLPTPVVTPHSADGGDSLRDGDEDTDNGDVDSEKNKHNETDIDQDDASKAADKQDAKSSDNKSDEKFGSAEASGQVDGQEKSMDRHAQTTDTDATKNSNLSLKAENENKTETVPVSHAMPDTAKKTDGNFKQSIGLALVGIASALGYKKTKKQD
ncbi:DUF1542 domain-containing protein [Fructobacillus sp. M2-14]|uniref:DUF1542 domain-containing protein n=1 Tax=Fructobacillus broussonetiae TaxID=2713173 RepID=A0ABS5QYN7_9LACO|nr:DUF1542 domain-containing protein [Fructobacillus broussonetiae]